MADLPGATDTTFPPRPLPATYWVAPGRFLVGEHPGSQSRAEAMDRLRRFLVAGVTCFVDLTEPGELPSYESLLPQVTPDGRRIEYLREPIRDHDVPSGDAPVSRAIDMIDEALEAGHVVYLHCRAGIGRSATVVGCWLATRGGVPDPLEELQLLWRQSARSRDWPVVPETDEQADFVRGWSSQGGAARKGPGRHEPVHGGPGPRCAARARTGDATGEAQRTGTVGEIIDNDYKLIDNSHMVVVYHPRQSVSAGVMCEMVYAKSLAKLVYVYYPYEPSPFFEW